MGRISAIYKLASDGCHLSTVRDMLASYSGPQNIFLGDNFSLGSTAPDINSSIVKNNRGVLLFDGSIYDIYYPSGRGVIKSLWNAELVAELILEYGVTETLSMINGDFSLVWVDVISKSFWLARDPLGMRPLYYAKHKTDIFISSQPRGILATGQISNCINPDYLVRYGAMHYRMIDNEPKESPYSDIKQVEASKALCFDRHGMLSEHQFWSINDEPDFLDSEEYLAERYAELLSDAVRIRLLQFPKRIFTLSGGMDSSSILACASKHAGKQTAYSTLYEDKTYDEREEIADMLPDNVSDWQQVVLSNKIDLIAEVDELISIHDEPIATATWLSHHQLCKQASKYGYAGIFGGLGGDELNAGEYEYFPFHFADLKQEGKLDSLKNELNMWALHHDHPVHKKTPKIGLDLMNKLADFEHIGHCLPDYDRLYRYLSVLEDDYDDLKSFNPRMEGKFKSYLKTRTWQDLTRETLPCCIRAEDRHGAAYDLPPVLPFLDKRLIEFMYRIPGKYKINGGVTKILLRKAMKGVLPEPTRSRIKKTGWNAPSHQWFSGKGAENLRDLVNSVEFRSLGLYKASKVLKIIDEHELMVAEGRPSENHMMFLWPLLNILRWKRILDDSSK